MAWNAARASTFLKNFADKVCHDAYHMDGDELLYAAGGAAYYAVVHGVGYNTKEEFEDFWFQHLMLDKDFLQEALQQIER